MRTGEMCMCLRQSAILQVCVCVDISVMRAMKVSAQRTPSEWVFQGFSFSDVRVSTALNISLHKRGRPRSIKEGVGQNVLDTGCVCVSAPPRRLPLGKIETLMSILR